MTGGEVWPGFPHWIDIALIGLSLSLTGCGGPAVPHGTPSISRDAGVPSVLAARCGDGHPPVSMSCCQIFKGAT